MPSDARLTPKARRAILGELTRDRLSEITTHLGLDVVDRRSSDAHIQAIVRKHSLEFRAVLDLFGRDELKAACVALGLDAGGREKQALVDRIVGSAATRTASVEMPDDPKNDVAPEAPSEGALKSALRRLVVKLAGGARGRDAAATFTSLLLRCFGWPASGPTGALLAASLDVVERGQRTTRRVALWWPERRVLVDVAKDDVALQAQWKDLLGVCLQMDPLPQYVMLTNQRDVLLYDLGRDREAPRLAIALDELPKYSEAFAFLRPDWTLGETPKIINVSKVSLEVADLVARLYRSLKKEHPQAEREVVQFTLQCILTMFAEDIGLLPEEHFTTLLYEGARHGDVEKRLRSLFRLMSTKDVPGRTVPYFNGGLFSSPVILPLGEKQLAALTKASEANWKFVDPHIFGSVFQGIMNEAERHKSGAHYTAHDDIMRIVGPTIVEPWRKRIRDAKTLTELLEVRAALLAFRVLDPACGSGNFLYVAFREMYRLDTELLSRVREFPSTQGQTSARVNWSLGIQTGNFFGIDINPFAVELAKVTLNIAKKIAFDERRETAADLVGQLELDIDPSLPLDNLDKNIVCADALFTPWPEADAIVGNPPFLGDRKIRSELGIEYLRRLQTQSGVEGVVDICCHWFRLAHERLATGCRAGLVGTSGIRVGKARESSLDYIVATGGTITSAVSSRLWPGEAALNVSMVNWIKGLVPGPHVLTVDDVEYYLPRVPTHLQLLGDASGAVELKRNKDGAMVGLTFGSDAFMVSPTALDYHRDLRKNGVLRPLSTATALLTAKLSSAATLVICLGDCVGEAEASTHGGPAFAHLKRTLRPHVLSVDEQYPGWAQRWWQPWRPRPEYFFAASRLRRVACCAKVQARGIFAFMSASFVPNDTLQIFAFDDDYTFGVLQSDLHWAWTKAKGGRVTDRIRYTNDVWSTFPWPQEPTAAEVEAVARAARELRGVRDALMKRNGWSLRALYQAAEVAGPHPLKDAHAALDAAVRAAYGMPGDLEASEFLLELNKLVAQDEAEGRAVQGPGVPRGLDPRDPRWNSDDCIQPPAEDPHV